MKPSLGRDTFLTSLAPVKMPLTKPEREERINRSKAYREANERGKVSKNLSSYFCDGFLAGKILIISTLEINKLLIFDLDNTSRQ